jgi:hypothetical protein
MRTIITLFLISFFVTTQAQKFPLFENYQWEKNPQWSENTEKDALYYYSKYTLAIEYEFDDYYGRYYKYKTEHYRVKLNSHIAIEEFNKMYISMENAVSLKNIKARVIKSDETVEFKPKVEEFYSDDASEQYYYFPIEGIEIGDEIEILYTLKMESAVDGDQFFFQGEMPIYNFDFYFIGPTDAYFSFLPHGGFPKPELVDTIKHRHQWTCHLDTIDAYKAEYFSEYNNSAMKLDVTLRGFDNAGDRSYSPYENIEKDLNAVYNIPLKGKEIKSVQALSIKLGITPRTRTEEKIRIIENYIKLNIANTDVPLGTPMSEIIETERASSIGTIQLFMALFYVNDIRFEYGFTSDRYDTHFSSEIESMHFLQSYIFYFPDVDKYLAPLDFSTRLGFLSEDWIPNNALLFTMKQYPIPVTRGSIKSIPATTARQNLDSTIVTIRVGSDYRTFEIEIERHITGYEAGEFQTYYYLYNDAKKETKSEELLDVLNDNSTFKVTSLQNFSPEDAYVKPLIVKGHVTELHVPLIEFAGDVMIFKLGHLFGEYTSLKEIERKKHDFVFGNPFSSSTTIHVLFPEGSKVNVPQEIQQSDDLFEHPEIKISSKMEIVGNKVTYIHGSQFDKNQYSIEIKDVMTDVFVFWNSLHKMNLLVQKPL